LDGASSFSAHSHVTGTTIVLKVLFQEQEVLLMKQKTNTIFGIMMSQNVELCYMVLVSNHSYGYGITILFNGKDLVIDQTSDFDKISEYFHIIKLWQPEIQSSTQTLG
jgi:hypothetical protein